MSDRYPARIIVLSGVFASQPLAFARLLDAADRAGLFIDLGDVDVIRHAPEVRLAHYFPPGVVGTIEELRGSDDTLLLVKPGLDGREVHLPIDDPMLRHLGVFEGEIVRASSSGDWA